MAHYRGERISPLTADLIRRADTSKSVFCLEVANPIPGYVEVSYGVHGATTGRVYRDASFSVSNFNAQALIAYFKMLPPVESIDDDWVQVWETELTLEGC